MYIVTREINQYDQDGEYFFAAFIEKPNREQLLKLFNGDKLNVKDQTLVSNLLKGGGRRKTEYEWYNLVEVTIGKRYSNGHT